MGKIGVYVIEDEPLYAGQLEMLIDELDYDMLGVSDNSDTAKVEIERLKPDLLLVDINIRGTMDGIELVKSLDAPIPAIFITSFTDQETFDRAKETNPYAYLAKPFDSQNLQQTIELALNRTGLTGDHLADQDLQIPGAFFVKNRNKLEKVEVRDVQYLEVENRYSTIITDSGKKFVLRMSMGEVQKRLPSNSFIRIHRKYAVNLNKVKSIDVQDNLLFLDDVQLPISRSNKEELLRKLKWMQ